MLTAALWAAFSSLAGLSAGGFVPQAEAQQICPPREAAIAHLENNYDEHVIGRGLIQGAREMIEVLVSKTGTWTVLITDIQGRSCMVAAGQGWEPVGPPAGRSPSAGEGPEAGEAGERL